MISLKLWPNFFCNFWISFTQALPKFLLISTKFCQILIKFYSDFTQILKKIAQILKKVCSNFKKVLNTFCSSIEQILPKDWKKFYSSWQNLIQILTKLCAGFDQVLASFEKYLKVDFWWRLLFSRSRKTIGRRATWEAGSPTGSTTCTPTAPKLKWFWTKSEGRSNNSQNRELRASSNYRLPICYPIGIQIDLIGWELCCFDSVATDVTITPLKACPLFCWTPGWTPFLSPTASTSSCGTASSSTPGRRSGSPSSTW